MQQQLNDITLKFFRYFDSKFRGLNHRLAEQDKHIEGLYQLIDSYVQQTELQAHDALIDNARLSRVEKLLYASLGNQETAELQL